MPRRADDSERDTGKLTVDRSSFLQAGADVHDLADLRHGAVHGLDLMIGQHGPHPLVLLRMRGVDQDQPGDVRGVGRRCQ